MAETNAVAPVGETMSLESILERLKETDRLE